MTEDGMSPHDFWQTVHPRGHFTRMDTVHDVYVAEIGTEVQLCLPIRPLADGEHALCSLIVNQASFEVQDLLAAVLAEQLKPFAIDVVAGLPTLGLTLASAVARKLGHHRYVPLGTSRKFWYRDELSVPLSSITTPTQQKRLYVDPRMLPLLQGRRVALVDDVISSGASIAAGLALMAGCGIEPVVIAAAMLQSDRWRDRLDALDRKWSDRIVGAFATPMLVSAGDGNWRAQSEY